MKRDLALICLIIFITGISCKKSNSGNSSTQQLAASVSVTTVAGSTFGYEEGALANAKFKYPSDIAIDANGTIFIADSYNHRIRKITNGQVSTFVGSGTPGIVNGNGTAASFKFPVSLVTDPAGNLYVTDVEDPTIRKISTGADVTTYAGSMRGLKDGRFDTAQFNVASSMIADAQGNIYMADDENNCIRKVGLNGMVTTVAGDSIFGFRNGNGKSARFASPTGIAVDNQGNLYVSDNLNYCIRKITPGGDVTTFAGTAGNPGFNDGNGSAAQFSDLYDIVIDRNGNLYVGDGPRVRKVTPQGDVITVAGSTTAGFADGDGLQARFYYAVGLAIDAQGNIYVADLNNHRIRKITFR